MRTSSIYDLTVYSTGLDGLDPDYHFDPVDPIHARRSFIANLPQIFLFLFSWRHNQETTRVLSAFRGRTTRLSRA